RESPVASLTSVTLAPERTAPLGSVTVPSSVPLTACAAARRGARAMMRTRQQLTTQRLHDPEGPAFLLRMMFSERARFRILNGTAPVLGADQVRQTIRRRISETLTRVIAAHSSCECEEQPSEGR